MDLKGSRTEKKLLAAFAGESQARTRCTFFASGAKKEGYEQISAIFQETTGNEKERGPTILRSSLRRSSRDQSILSSVRYWIKSG